jgi:hypothetical protein
VCSHTPKDSDLNLHKGGDLYVFKTVPIFLILPLIHCKYVILSPVPIGMIYNVSRLPTTRADVWGRLELPLNFHLCLHDAGLIMKWDKCTFCVTL